MPLLLKAKCKCCTNIIIKHYLKKYYYCPFCKKVLNIDDVEECGYVKRGCIKND